MRYTPKKVDANQHLIVASLRKIGCSVVDTSRIGQGFPDLIVGFRGITILMEVKNEGGKNRLTRQQEDFISKWNGSSVHVVRSEEQAVEVVNSYGV